MLNIIRDIFHLNDFFRIKGGHSSFVIPTFMLGEK